MVSGKHGAKVYGVFGQRSQNIQASQLWRQLGNVREYLYQHDLQPANFQTRLHEVPLFVIPCS